MAHLPSINVLRAFEATARHLSFTRAATELNLTQTAISHRVKELEGLLNVQVFTRKQNAVSLTDEGSAYLDLIRPALTQIANATDSFSSVRENRLKVICLGGFTLDCLLPALGSFAERHPDIELRLTPSVASERPDKRDFDVAIWHGPGEWPGFLASRIAVEEVFPVAAPSLVHGKKPALRSPEDLRHFPIVRTVSPTITDDWPVWLQHVGKPSVEFGRQIYCESLYFSMKAARTGLGVAIARSSLVRSDLANGTLVDLFGKRLVSESAYYAVCRPEKARLPRVRLFVAWLLEHFNNA